ncbi:glutathione S-transferase [Trinickia symbiotica]|uniref:Glutathione S-transferase n=1 Tax=Trinickia symbiotica TaxID=863227 RepID=A0A2N7X141_9BURK|nr:glutathione transferase [Trinickia symbiotica]PMS35449.1 glutathione S-transferase [Trinickia symbiotica]PPK45475.1 glutathione S-transferase [Trinickia symbiotica]
MNASPIYLYVGADYVSAFAMSAFVVLKEKGLDFEIRTVDLKAKQQHSSAYREISLTRRVPTLLHGDFSLSESSAVAEYLEEVYPAPRHAAVLPADRETRARARELQAWIRSDFMPLKSERQADRIYFPEPVKPLSEPAQLACDKLLDAADRLIRDDRHGVFGDWCIADTDFALMLNRLVACGDPVPPKVLRYVERQWARPSVQQWVARPRG